MFKFWCVLLITEQHEKQREMDSTIEDIGSSKKLYKADREVSYKEDSVQKYNDRLTSYKRSLKYI